MKKLAILCWSLLSYPLFAESPTLELFKNGEKTKTYTLDELKKEVGQQEVELTEPHMKAKKTFQALPFEKVLTKVYGKNWKDAKSLVATCQDGYKPTISLKRLQEGKPYLAFGMKDSAFEVTKAGKVIPVGPYYLVWSHKMDDAQRLHHLHEGNWPYRIKSLDLVY